LLKRNDALDIDFTKLFHIALGKEIDSYPYQKALAHNTWPDIVKIPTGMGKTAAIILAWLFKRLQKDSHTPRRLIYCLPMRVLVDQTQNNARKWINNLVNSNMIPPDRKPSVHVLMGGEVDADWDRYPEHEAIIIGTQDMLLSRALNRGYAMSRFRWPIQFGLLNNDCLWVMDEIQLMGSGLATTAQLQAFRNSLGTSMSVSNVWMSATLQRDWLNTVDFKNTASNLYEIGLSDDDLNHPSVKKRINARKTLIKAGCSADKPLEIAELTIRSHKKGTRTLVVVNTVKRAVQVFQALKRKKPKAELTLVHSRFRPPDRQAALEKILNEPGPEGTICVSTQVIEAGVDISATTLITDLAPWSSLVQRFGRCNRYGIDEQARVYWLDIDLSKKGSALPYSTQELSLAAELLNELDNVSPSSLPPVDLKADFNHVLRRKDIIDLFDTTPDLAGMDIDISRFIRESEDNGCQVFWRDSFEESPTDKEPAPTRDELCSVPIGDLKAQRKKAELRLWYWDHLEKSWQRPPSISPGMIFMLHKSAGCYKPEFGWTGKKSDIPEIYEKSPSIQEAIDDDPQVSRGWQSLSDHTDAVVNKVTEILSNFELPDEYCDSVLLAARWHDSGKAHGVFQEAMVGDPPEAETSIIWGKTGRTSVAYKRRGFRHELASALAMLEHKLSDLSVFLAAAHHGKVRLSIRSLPIEKPPPDCNLRFARGVWEGDILKTADLGDGHEMSETELDLSYMEFGDGLKGASWLARMIALRDNPSIGPFRLAFMEALLRTADWRASERIDDE
jgi:CRISPR-associated endonuclease/helicase Cas3